jgi:ABC-type uncharacterized transport system YnjBCD ATPase subunit
MNLPAAIVSIGPDARPAFARIRLGASFSLIAPKRPDRDALIQYLSGLSDEIPPCWADTAVGSALHDLREASAAHVAVAAEDGALLQWLDSWNNIVLPLYYESPDAAAAAEQRAEAILLALGETSEIFRGRPVAALSLYEQRLAGFLKAMLVEPQLLVLDGLHERLGRAEQRQVTAWIELFSRRYPLRRMLYVGLAAIGEPQLLPGFAPLDALERAP